MVPRRIYPHLITHEIISIQPMTQEEFNNQIELRKARYSKTAKFGSILPSWLSPMIFDGNEFIPVKQFISWFGKDKIITKDRHYKKLRSVL